MQSEQKKYFLALRHSGHLSAISFLSNNSSSDELDKGKTDGAESSDITDVICFVVYLFISSSLRETTGGAAVSSCSLPFFD